MSDCVLMMRENIVVSIVNFFSSPSLAKQTFANFDELMLWRYLDAFNLLRQIRNDENGDDWSIIFSFARTVKIL